MPSTDDYKKTEIEIQFHHNRAKAVLQMRLHLHKESLREQTHSLCTRMVPQPDQTPQSSTSISFLTHLTKSSPLTAFLAWTSPAPAAQAVLCGSAERAPNPPPGHCRHFCFRRHQGKAKFQVF